MFENDIDEAIIYSYFTYSKVNKKNEEKGLICINVIKPTDKNSPKSFGWEKCSYWVNFNDELFKYLKGVLVKKSTLKVALVPDYKDSNRYTSKLIQINDFVIKD